MKIKSFETTSPLFPAVSFESDKPICFFSGASVFLHMMRCLIDEAEEGAPIDTEKEKTFVSRLKFELDGKEHELCGILCDDQSFFIAADTKNGFSESETKKCLSQLFTFKSDEKNYYCHEHKYIKNEKHLSASEYAVEIFKRFLEIVKRQTENGDIRPIYIFNFFERIDEAVDNTSMLDGLASLGRQVFVSVSANYPVEKMSHDKVQIVRLALQGEDIKKREAFAADIFDMLQGLIDGEL